MDRFWEIDLLKTIAITMMVIFHTIVTIVFFGGLGDITPWIFFGRLCAFLFILLVGINLSYTKKNKSELVIRGVKIIMFGILVSILTWISYKDYYVRFGVLHFIGTSIILSIPFLNKKFLNLILGWIIFMMGVLHYKPPGFYTFDHFTLFPWFGVILIGIFIGKEFYTKKGRLFHIFEPSNNVKETLYFISKNSLLIYFLHIPVIIIVLKLLNLV